MQTVEVKVDVDAPREAVWQFLEDVRRYPEWIDFVREVTEVSETPPRLGTRYVERAKPGPKEGTYAWTITAWEPPRRQVHEHSGGEMEIHLTIDLADRPGGTAWTHRLEFRALPAFRPLGWVLERTVMKAKLRRDLTRVLANAKRIIEKNGKK
jgi:uncharacterized membrane protein